jgi:TonB family protein
MKRAFITSRPEPGFTEAARRNDVEGVVRLRAVLNVSGEVTDISVVKGLPDGLTERAVAAAKQIKFTPAERDGRKVSQYVELDYVFVTTFMRAEDVDEPAVILEKPPAEYPYEARSNGVRGKVVLKVALTKFGRVSLRSVEQGLPHGLTERAVAASERIKFKPARLGGRDVSQLATVEYVFAP